MRRRRWRVLWGAAAVWVLGGCGGGKVDLLLDLRTDLQPGLEFREVRTELFERIPASSDSASNERVRVRTVEPSEAFVRGERIAVFSGLKPGTHAVRVRLVDRQGEAFVQRIALLMVRKTSVFTIVMTRDCRGVECPGPDDDPSAIACLGGRCVHPGCTPETPEFCPTGVCEVDVTCVAAAACARAQCTDEGTCLRVGDNGACPVGQWCHPDVGCLPLPDAPIDAGVDGGVVDATDSGLASISVSVRRSVLAGVVGLLPRVAWTGSELGIVYMAGGIRFSRWDLTSSPLGAEVTVATAGSRPDVIWNPDMREFAFTWVGDGNERVELLVRPV